MIGADLIPRNHVPGSGDLDAQIMFIGEAPGFVENRDRTPFVGPAGMEKRRYERSAGMLGIRSYTTNICKYWPPQTPNGKQLPPTEADIIRDEPELLMELDMVRPRIIGAIGAHAARYFLGHKFRQIFQYKSNQTPRLFRDHGIPHLIRAGEPIGRLSDPKYLPHDVVVVPLYHPSAGLHSSPQQIQIQWDFRQLGKLLRGQIPPHPPVNPYPNPHYEILTDQDADRLRSILAGKCEIAIDTEGDQWQPECLTFCVEPGSAYLIEPESRLLLQILDAHINAYGSRCTVIFHYAGHDIPVVEVDQRLGRLAAMGVRVNRYRAVQDDGTLSIRCTMSELYLLGGVHPKGLKPASWRLLGVEMEDYPDVVGPTEREKSLGYLQDVFSRLMCPSCGGVGKFFKIGKEWNEPDPDCYKCSGSGQLRYGKSGKLLKHPRRCDHCMEQHAVVLKSSTKCENCSDGLLVPMPDREFIFDPAKSEFRWKQPQSLGKWIKKRLEKAFSDGDEADSDALLSSDEADADSDEPTSEFFKLRHDWDALEDRNDKLHVERICGPMPRTRLFDVPDRQRVIRYACTDAHSTFLLSRETTRLLAEHQSTTVQRIDAAAIPMLSHMEQVGMLIDREDCERFSAELETEMDQIRDRLSGIVGSKTNPNSPMVADILFRQLGLPVIKLTKSKTRESIDDDVLGALEASLKKRGGDDPASLCALEVIGCVRDYRELQKHNGVCKSLLKKADRNDRIHTTLNYATVATGRLSSEDPNLQNIPNPDNSPVYGKRLRNLFIAPPGYVLISADYSQIEMVVGAHLTQDPGMLEVFRRGLDLHTYAASLMFGIPYDQVPKNLRTQVKPLNFGCFYGLSAMGLQAQFASLPAGAIEKTEAECQELIDRYYEAFPGVMAWKRELWKQAKISGYVETMFGRKRLTPGLRSDIEKVRAAAEREAGNQPIQGTAQDILKIGMAGIWERALPMFWDEGIDIQPLNQVHDEVLFQCPEEHAADVLPVIEAEMKYAVKLSVPIKVGLSVAKRWGELK